MAFLLKKRVFDLNKQQLLVKISYEAASSSKYLNKFLLNFTEFHIIFLGF